jgi:nicotinate-nucleotide adenylyltransferase
VTAKLGILGGTFNPIHLAHLRVAEEVRELCGLDRVLFIPAAMPPHKALADDIPFAHRCAMVRAAIADHPQFAVSDLEARRPGKSYSVRTLELLREEYPDDEFYFIIGMDSYRSLEIWKDYPRLFDLANLVVAARPGSAGDDPLRLLPVVIQDQFCYDDQGGRLLHRSGNRVIFLSETFLDISSTHIRKLVAAGRSLRYLVPAAVADYIDRHGLYRCRERC